MSIKCGSCGATHESVAGVRACYGDSGSIAIATREPESAPEMSIGRGDYGRPERQRSHGGPTPKMVKYIRDLIAARDIPLGPAVTAEDALARGEMSFQEAREFLDRYKDAPRKSGNAEAAKTSAPERVTQDGMYRNPETGEIYKAQYARAAGSGHLYAKRLVVATEAERDTDGKIVIPALVEFEYVPGLIGDLRPEWRMTLAEASEWGALYGRCLRCNRTLTLEESIERAMGRICANKINWA